MTLLFYLLTNFAYAESVKPFLTCDGGSGDVVSVSLYSIDSKEVPDIYVGPLLDCQNKSSGTDMVVKYPATGSKVKVDGESKIFWIAAVVTDGQGQTTTYYQYSDYFSRAFSCSQGLFISDNREILDLRADEPRSRLGEARLDNQKYSLRCQN